MINSVIYNTVRPELCDVTFDLDAPEKPDRHGKGTIRIFLYEFGRPHPVDCLTLRPELPAAILTVIDEEAMKTIRLSSYPHLRQINSRHGKHHELILTYYQWTTEQIESYRRGKAVPDLSVPCIDQVLRFDVSCGKLAIRSE